MTEKQLKKERRGFIAMELFWLFFSLACVMPLLLLGKSGLDKLDIFQRLGFLSALIGGAALSVAMYAQVRILEAEINFELRLREALANKQSS